MSGSAGPRGSGSAAGGGGGGLNFKFYCDMVNKLQKQLRRNFRMKLIDHVFRRNGFKNLNDIEVFNRVN